MKLIDRVLLAVLGFGLCAIVAQSWTAPSKAQSYRHTYPTRSITRHEVEAAVRTVLREQQVAAKADVSAAVQKVLRTCTLTLSQVAERDSDDPVRWIGNINC